MGSCIAWPWWFQHLANIQALKTKNGYPQSYSPFQHKAGNTAYHTYYIIRILGFWYIIHKRIILKHRRELRVCHKVCKSLQILYIYIYIYVYFKLINLTLYVFKWWWKFPCPPCLFLLFEYSIFQIPSCSIYCIYLNYDLSSYSKIGFQVL